MKKILFILSILLLIINFLPNRANASTLSCAQVNGMSIFGYDYDGWKFIGSITSKYDSDSIANDYGTYGSKYSSDSINNDYGTYGGQYSSNSAFNDYTSSPPIIVSDNYQFVGYLTTNEYHTPNINTYEAIACANNSYSSSNMNMEDITFKSIPSGVYSGLGGDYSSGYVSTAPVSQYTCPVNSHTSTTDVTKCDCDAGYQINSTRDACILAPTKTNDQLCQDSFGSYSKWDGGNKNNDGTLNCQCQAGYQFNNDKSSCVAMPTPTPIISVPAGCFESNGQLFNLTTGAFCGTSAIGCTSSLGFSSTTGMSCDGSNKCSSGMQFNEDKTGCINIPEVTSKVTPKPTISVENKKVEAKVETNTKTYPTATVTETPTEIKIDSPKLPWYQRLFNWIF